MAHDHAGVYATAAQGALADAAVQPEDLATVAISGAYSDLTGKPTLGTAADNAEGDFAPAVHGHAIADTTGLQTALDAKAATGHGHAIADTTGLQTALDGKAATTHHHDADYADITHDHDADYAALGHSHSGLVPTGGAQGYVLKKASGADHDLTWAVDATGEGGESAVTSVFTRTGDVTAQSGDHNAGQITETATAKIMTDAERTKLAGVEAGATADQTAAEILTAVKTVDGAGSGLDADTLDGQEAAAFASAAQGALADSAVQPADLATVATTGVYADLTGKPTLGTAADNAETDFAAAAHTHVKANITDFAHTHPSGEVTGLSALATKSTVATADINGDAVDNTKLANMAQGHDQGPGFGRWYRGPRGPLGGPGGHHPRAGYGRDHRRVR